MLVTALAGGVGGARFLRGLRAAAPTADLTVVGNTADDMTVFGLRVCPDLDTVMYTLGDAIDEDRGWGRRAETWTTRAELTAYAVGPTWFGLGDRDLATHLVRTELLASGLPLSAVTERLCRRWRPGVRLLPMSDDPVETHVTVDDPDRAGHQRQVHFQEYWVRMRAEPVARQVVVVGAERAGPGPGVIDALLRADVVVLAPSNPVVSVGTILSVSGVRAALRERRGPVVGLSPIVGGAPLRGMADRVLPAVGVDSDAGAVGRWYGARGAGGVLDGWLVDERDAAVVPAVEAAGIACRAVPLLMRDLAATKAMAVATLRLAEAVTR